MIFKRPVAHITSLPPSQEELKGWSLSVSQKPKMQVRVIVFYWRLCAGMKHQHPNTLWKMQVFIKRYKMMKSFSYKSIILDCRHQQVPALLKPRTEWNDRDVTKKNWFWMTPQIILGSVKPCTDFCNSLGSYEPTRTAAWWKSTILGISASNMKRICILQGYKSWRFQHNIPFTHGQ